MEATSAARAARIGIAPMNGFRSITHHLVASIRIIPARVCKRLHRFAMDRRPALTLIIAAAPP
jgi:hypothetical protein